MDFDQLKTELNIRLGDADNFAFTDDEKTSVLTEAINDGDVVQDTWNNYIVYDSTQFQYPVPNDVSAIYDLYVNPTNDASRLEKVDPNLWERVGDNIHFKNGAGDYLTSGDTVYIRGAIKLSADDTITELRVREFVLKLAHLKCMSMYGTKKAFKFVKNDTSVAEVVALKRELERDVQAARAALEASIEVA